jgi:transposase InsO family protein
MSSSDTLPKTEKYPHEKLSLDGSNYSQWATGFKMWAGGLGLWSYISGEEQEPSPPAPLSDADQNIIRQEKHQERVKIFKQRRLLALSALSTAIDAQDFVYLRDVADPHDGWTSLANKYLPQKTIRFNQYLDRLFTIPKAHDSPSISQTLQMLVLLKADLAALASSSRMTTTPPVAATTTSSSLSQSPAASQPPDEYKVPDAIFVHVLRMLPDYYDPFRQALVNSTTSLDFNDVVNRLKTQELHRAGTGGTTEHTAMLSGHRGGDMLPQKGERVAPRGFDESKGDGWMMGWRPKCGHCSKPGHVWVQCRARLSKDEKGPKSALPLPSPSAAAADTDTLSPGPSDQDASPPFVLTLNTHSASISSTADVPPGLFHVDSASTAHMEPDISRFSHYTKLREPIRVTLADDHVVLAPGWGTVKLLLRFGELLTERPFEFLHVPDLRCTLISVSALASACISFTTSSKGGILRSCDGTGPSIANVRPQGGLYLLDATYAPMPDATAAAFIVRSPSVSGSPSIHTWHRRFGHAGLSTILKAVAHVGGLDIDHSSLTPGVDGADAIHCVSCVMGKQRRLPFPLTARRADKVAELIHSDVWGPVDIPSSTGDSYFVVFTDDHTRYSTVSLMRHKSDVFDCFRRFLSWIETQSGHRVKRLRSDNGGEYISQDFRGYLADHGIEHEVTMPYTPQQNGVAERGHQTVVTRALSSHHLSGFPRSFWGWAILNSAHIRNVLPSSALAGRTPFEVFYGRQPDVAYLRPFGALAYAHIPEDTRRKYSYVSRRCFLLGHVRNAGYVLWDPAAKRVVRSRHVCFDEHVFYGDPSPSPLTSLLPSLPVAADTAPAAATALPSSASVGALGGEPPSSNPADTTVSQASVGGNAPPPAVPAPILVPPEPAAPPAPRRTTRIRQPAQIGYTAPSGTSATAIPAKHIPVAERWTYAPIVPTAAPATANTSLPMETPNTEHAMHTSTTATSMPPPKAVIPGSINHARSLPEWPKWSEACESELKSMQDMNTHHLVPLPDGRKAVGSKWVFTVKTNEEGNIIRHKARLVAQGFTQVEGIDYTETFAAVAKYDTVRILLALAAKFDLELDQMDIRTAFLNADLKEDIYLKQPAGFEDAEHPDWVWKLDKALYGLKQAGYEWNQTLDQYLRNEGFNFVRSEADHSLYVLHEDGKVIWLVVYVDDMLTASNSRIHLDAFKTRLKQRFDLSDLGPARHFLGMHITRDREQRIITVSQKAYLEKILENAGMSQCNPVSTPMTPGITLQKATRAPTQEEVVTIASIPYRRTIGELNYAMRTTRPDIAYSVSSLSRYMENPSIDHHYQLKHLLRYIRGTTDLMLVFGSSNNGLIGHSDSDYAADRDDSKSTSAYVYTLFGGPISWKCQKQSVVATSTTEAEYIGLSNASREALYLTQLLHDFRLDPTLYDPALLYGDNQASIALSKNPKFHERAKHIRVHYHLIRDLVDTNKIDLRYKPTSEMIADSLTKALPRPAGVRHRWEMGLRQESTSSVSTSGSVKIEG